MGRLHDHERLTGLERMIDEFEEVVGSCELDWLGFDVVLLFELVAHTFVI